MTYGASLWAQRAHADLPLLSWSAPADCPDSSVVRQRIAAWLGKPDTAAAPDAAVHASGVVTRNRRGGYQLTLTVTEGDVSGTRRLFGQDCRQLSDTAAFLIAVATDPNAGASAHSPPPAATEPPASTEPPAVAEPEATLAPAPPSEPTRGPPGKQAKPPAPRATTGREDASWSIHGAGFGGLWQDKLPSLQAVAGGSVGAAYGIWQVEFRGGLAFRRAHQIPAISDNGRARASTQSYGLAACALWQLGPRLRAGPCATLSLLSTHALSEGVSQRQSAHKLWSVFGLGAQVSVELVRHVELFGEGGASVPIVERPAFGLDTALGRTPVLTAAKFAYYGSLGARIRWGLEPRGRP